MCGLVGILERAARPVDRARLERMVTALAHRGPDGSGTHLDGALGLGHTRLAILDLEGGAQPLCNEDQTVWVAFNGEIYNHLQLAAELAEQHVFKTRSDTEVLVHLYEERGLDFVQALDGFFAFALWDSARQRLILARDRLGKKPLFFARSDERLLFASEPRAILAALDQSPELDPLALLDVLSERHVSGGRSGYAGIEQLAPGELLCFDVTAPGHSLPQPVRRSYWQLPEPASEQPANALDMRSALARFRELFDAAVERRLEADVPLGLLLSGGLDSTAVLESMSRIARQRSADNVRTFTVAFSRESDSEATQAADLARHFGSEHHEFQLSERDLLQHVEEVLPHLDEPFADPSFLPTTLVCGLAREVVTVALGGDGGDELFGGYDRYARTLAHADLRSAGVQPQRPNWAARLARRLGGSSGPLERGWKRARQVERSSLTPEAFYATELCALEPALRALLSGPRLIEASRACSEPREQRLSRELAGPAPLAARLMRHDLQHYLPGLILTKVDRASMARSLEMRAPFLDRALVEWAQTLPVEFKIAAGQRKRLVREALQASVPRSLWDRPKQGFGTPLGRWFRHDLAPYADGHLTHSRLASDGWLDQAGIDRVRQAHRLRRRNLGETLWTLLSLEVWYRRWVLTARGESHSALSRRPSTPVDPQEPR